jgi:hypothetical protein
MRREGSFAKSAKVPPKVPPKPTHLTGAAAAAAAAKRHLRRDLSLPSGSGEPSGLKTPQFRGVLRRETSCDSLASTGATSIKSFRSVSNMSRIPLWKGSQEKIMGASCSNLKELSYVETRSRIPGPVTASAVPSNQLQQQFRQRTLSSSSSNFEKRSHGGARMGQAQVIKCPHTPVLIKRNVN